MVKDRIEHYLTTIEKSLAAGNATEHTHRPALKTLLDELGREALGMNIDAVNEPKRIACGAPDFIVVRGEIPLGYVEAKDVDSSLDEIQKSEQLNRYLESLPNLILTDYLEFRWYVDGELRLSSQLAATSARQLRRIEGGKEATTELLNAFFAATAPTVGTPEELANRLARIARLIRVTIANALADDPEGGTLRDQMAGFKEVLLHDLTEDQFADMYAQTLSYGLFAARCNSKRHPFTREQAAFDLPRTNPFLRQIFGYVAGPDLDDRIVWAVDDVAELLNRADMRAILEHFGRRTRQEDPVVHFYETFLKAYDPAMREMRGVYYTPEPVVSYIVRSVDGLLKGSFNLTDGLADKGKVSIKNPEGKGNVDIHRVLVLDPAVGTGTFLHSVVDVVRERLRGNRGMWSSYVSNHLLPRVIGFELLMAPYAVAHMKLGLQLAETGYDFGVDERLRVYLTNTLEEAHPLANLPLFAKWLAEEANAASQVKQGAPVMVILGNPPYSGHSANKGAWISGLLRGKDIQTKRATESYFEVDGKPLGERNPKWLNDDYVKFIRFAQWRIEQTGYGILAFITNHGYLDNPTFRGMRRSLLRTFDDIYVLDLHGNKKKKERAPDGSQDDNVFDIQQGVAIGVFVKRTVGASKSGKLATVRHAHLWGSRETWEVDRSGRRTLVGGKYGWLWANDLTTTKWSPAKPEAPHYLFIPQKRGGGEYLRGWKLTEMMSVNVLGFQTHRDHFAIDFDEEGIASKLADMRSVSKTDTALRELYLLKDNRDWKLTSARAALKADKEWKQRIVRCLYRPFDRRWCFFGGATMDYPRRELADHVVGRDNICLLVPRQLGTEGWRHAFITRDVAESCVISTRTKEQNYNFPLFIYPTPGRDNWFGQEQGIDQSRRPNFSPTFVAACESQWGVTVVADGRGDGNRALGPEDILHYVYAILHSPSYRANNSEQLKLDFPRIPLIGDKGLFRALRKLGGELASIHLCESTLPLSVRYPIEGNNIVGTIRYTEPGQGHREGRVWINGEQYFERVTPAQWDHQIGGYQVAQKWLKDRKGRALSYDDLTMYQYVLAALSATRRIAEEIDAEIEKHGGWGQ